jgi:hypothetical protein
MCMAAGIVPVVVFFFLLLLFVWTPSGEPPSGREHPDGIQIWTEKIQRITCVAGRQGELYSSTRLPPMPRPAVGCDGGGGGGGGVTDCGR